MNPVRTFYDRYHRQNDEYAGVISRTNCTYWYILEYLHLAVPKLSNLRVLDVGCGVGTLPLYLAKHGALVRGIDISARAIRIAQKAAELSGLDDAATFEEVELKRGAKKYDLVVCSEVIEHIPNDVAFMKQLASHLKPGGVLLLTTPSRDNVLHQLSFYEEFDKEVGHLRRYTEEEVIQLIEQVGLEVVKLRSVEGPLRNLLFTTSLGFLVRGIKGPLVPIFHWFDRVSAKLFGAADIQVIARKS